MEVNVHVIGVAGGITIHHSTLPKQPSCQQLHTRVSEVHRQIVAAKSSGSIPLVSEFDIQSDFIDSFRPLIGRRNHCRFLLFGIVKTLQFADLNTRCQDHATIYFFSRVASSKTLWIGMSSDIYFSMALEARSHHDRSIH